MLQNFRQSLFRMLFSWGLKFYGPYTSHPFKGTARPFSAPYVACKRLVKKSFVNQVASFRHWSVQGVVNKVIFDRRSKRYLWAIA